MSNERNGEIKRAEPKPVPESWRDDANRYLIEREKFLESEEYAELKDPRKPIIETDNAIIFMKHVSPKIEDVFSFFESVLATQEVSDALRRQCERGEKMEKGEPYKLNYYDSTTLDLFGDWWLDKFTDYPVFIHRELSNLIWLIVTDPFFKFLRGSEISACYSDLSELTKYWESVAARKNSEVSDQQLRRE